MHVHAVARATGSYEHIDPELVGNERRILVSELSGRSNIVGPDRASTSLQRRPRADGRDPGTQVVELENQGYQFEAAEASFDLLVRRCAGTFRPHFERLNYHVERRDRRRRQRDHRGHGQDPRAAAGCGTKWPRGTAR